MEGGRREEEKRGDEGLSPGGGGALRGLGRKGGREREKCQRESSYLSFGSNSCLLLGILTMGNKHPDILKMPPSAINPNKKSTPFPTSSFHQHANGPQACKKSRTQCLHLEVFIYN